MKQLVDQAKAVKKHNPKEEAQREAAIKAAEKENGNRQRKKTLKRSENVLRCDEK